MAYIPNAVSSGDGTDNLTPIGTSGEALHLTLVSVETGNAQTTVAVNNQGLVDLLEAAVSGLEAKKPYLLALVNNADGSGPLEPLAKFMTNPAGAQIVITVGPLRRAVQGGEGNQRRFLVIVPLNEEKPGAPVQVQR